MDKKMCISIISLIIAIALFLIVWIMLENKDNKNEELSNNLKNEQVQNIVNISGSKKIEENTNQVKNENIIKEKPAQNYVADNNTHYLIKNENGYIYVYYLDKDNNEYLYKKTTISVNYLSYQDVEDLEIGIEVIGIENLNETLENFE